MKRIKLFTHTDLDGVGCAILALQAFSDIDIEYCNYNDINLRVEEFLMSSSQSCYDKIFITDISINEETLEIIKHKADGRVVILDHHKTALWLNKYDNFIVEEIDEELNEKTSGAYMFYKYLFKINKDSKLYKLCDTIRQYDTWIWKEKGLNYPKMLNDLFCIYGRDLFLNKILKYLNNEDEFLFNETDQLLLILKAEEIKDYIEDRNKSMFRVNYKNYKVGVVYADRFISEMGNKLCETNQDIDFIVIINMNDSISYRTIKDIDLSEIAKEFNGGGHPKASGSPITENFRHQVVSDYFSHANKSCIS